eukprot:CAMPEP_0178403706 /NCGR_PEP_ID=MMETSP0689_2-20121128/17508_1 /TAXON_ID=160604 /ORGANISM="Amphidinium massartii, Strain CS-259" /LENGTH=240 /DNA_ID=CAMNT_0020024671 /DNA_START=75 /DNA_END=797 /DNA_ORIENTATION=+
MVVWVLFCAAVLLRTQASAHKADPIVRSQQRANVHRHDHHHGQEAMTVDAHGNVAELVQDDPDAPDDDMSDASDVAAEAAFDTERGHSTATMEDDMPSSRSFSSDRSRSFEETSAESAEVDDHEEMEAEAMEEGEHGSLVQEPWLTAEDEAEQAKYQAATDKYQAAIGQAGRNMEEILPEDDVRSHGKVEPAHELAAALLGLGRHYEAVGWYRAAHEVAPSNPAIRQGLEEAQSFVEEDS